LNAFGPQTEAGHSVLENTEVRGEAQRAIGNLRVYGVQFNRRLFQLPGGRVAFAVAADYKEEDARLENNFAITDQLPAIFQDVSDVSGNRSSKGISVEASFPVLDNLELGLSVRYDDYSDFGNTTNPEFQFNYRTTPWLTLRGTYSTAFRAPTLYDMFRPDTIIFTANSHDDPLLCPGGVVNTAAARLRDIRCRPQRHRWRQSRSRPRGVGRVHAGPPVAALRAHDLRGDLLQLSSHRHDWHTQ
jgi:iron complex outermembrane receptor protein